MSTGALCKGAFEDRDMYGTTQAPSDAMPMNKASGMSICSDSTAASEGTANDKDRATEISRPVAALVSPRACSAEEVPQALLDLRKNFASAPLPANRPAGCVTGTDVSGCMDEQPVKIPLNRLQSLKDQRSKRLESTKIRLATAASNASSGTKATPTASRVAFVCAEGHKEAPHQASQLPIPGFCQNPLKISFAGLGDQSTMESPCKKFVPVWSL